MENKLCLLLVILVLIGCAKPLTMHYTTEKGTWYTGKPKPMKPSMDILSTGDTLFLSADTIMIKKRKP